MESSGRNGKVRYYCGKVGYFHGSIFAFSAKWPYIGGDKKKGELWINSFFMFGVGFFFVLLQPVSVARGGRQEGIR